MTIAGRVLAVFKFQTVIQCENRCSGWYKNITRCKIISLISAKIYNFWKYTQLISQIKQFNFDD